MYPYSQDGFAPKNAWYVAAMSGEVTRKPMERWIADVPIVMYRKENGEAVAVAARCPHRQFPLVSGYLNGDNIVCNYHGIEFGCTGTCVKIPAQKNVSPNYRLDTYDLIEKWGFLWVWVGDQSKIDYDKMISDKDFGIEDEGDIYFTVSHDYVKCRYQLLNDNLLDLSHAAYLHTGNFGANELATIEQIVEEDGNKIRAYRQARDVPTPPIFKDKSKTSHIDVYMDFTFHAPIIHIGYNVFAEAKGNNETEGDNIATTIVYHAITPARNNTCHYFHAICIKKGTQMPPKEILVESLRTVLIEDIVAVEDMEILIDDYDIKDRLIASDVAVTKGRILMQNMIKQEATV